MNRKEFLSGASPRLINAAAGAGKFYFALIAGSRIVDDFYRGPEGSPDKHALQLALLQRARLGAKVDFSGTADAAPSFSHTHLGRAVHKLPGLIEPR